MTASSELKVHLRRSRYAVGGPAICGTPNPALLTQNPREATCKRCLSAHNMSWGCSAWMLGIVALMSVVDWLRGRLTLEAILSLSGSAWIVTGFVVAGLSALVFMVAAVLRRSSGNRSG